MKYLNNFFILNCNNTDITNILVKRMDVYYNNPQNRKIQYKLNDLFLEHDEFEYADLSSISEITTGKTPKDRRIGFDSIHTIPMIKTSNIKRGKFIDIDMENDTFISNSQVNESGKVTKDDLLLTIVGASLSVVGRVTLYEKKEIAVINQNIARIRCDTSVVIPKYIMIYLNSNYGQKQIALICKQGSQINMNGKEVGEIKILIPPLEIQEKIILDFNVQDCYINHQKEIVNNGLNDINDILFKYLKLTEPNGIYNNVVLSKVTYKRLDFNYYNPKFNAYIECLKNKAEIFTLKTLDELAFDIYRGDSPSKYCEQGVMLLQVNNIDPYKIELNNTKFISEDEYNRKPRFQLEENDLLVSGVGPPLGEVCVVPKLKSKLAAYTHISVIKTNKELIDPFYLCAFLNSPFGQNQMKKHYTGIRQIYLTNEWIGKILVAVPSKTLQTNI